MRYLSTSDLAKAVGMHPNTVRRYLDRGLLPPVEYSPSGYRLFTPYHLDCLRLARLVYGGQYPVLSLRQSGLRVIKAAVAGDLTGALVQAERHLAFVLAERAEAKLAAHLLERWASGPSIENGEQRLRIGQVANLLDVTIDVLRNWDRNNLIDVPRDPDNGYRYYGSAEIDRLRIIRLLSRSGYSLAAILRMLLQLDRGEKSGLSRALDTPRPDEDAFTAADRWLSALAAGEQSARQILALVEEMRQKQAKPSLGTPGFI